MMENTKRGFMAAFLAIVLVALLAPLVLTVVTGEDGSGSGVDEQRVPWPSLVCEDGSPNVCYLSEMGAWFEGHFATRSGLLQLDQDIRGVFGATTSEKVVAGENGWLYYAGTLSDYEGTSPLTNRQMQSIAYNLSLAQGYVQAQGATFAVTLAPNKNTIYDESMPSRFVEATTDHNATVLASYLKNAGVRYVDLMSVLETAAGQSPTSLYYAKDTHWNEIGAAVAFEAILDSERLNHRAFGVGDFTWSDTADGDLNVMINPLGTVTECVPLLTRERDFAFRSGDGDVTSTVIETESATPEASDNGTLLMYRDSFGNNLVPYMAEAFSKAYFTKYTPYDLTLVSSLGAKHVIIERAERNLYSFASNPPVMPAPSTAVVATQSTETSTSVSCEADGSLWKIQGWFRDVEMDENSPVYVLVTPEGDTAPSGVAYVAFRTEALSGSKDTASNGSAGETVAEGTSGYMLHIFQESLPAGSYRISVVVSRDSQLVRVMQSSIVL